MEDSLKISKIEHKNVYYIEGVEEEILDYVQSDMIKDFPLKAIYKIDNVYVALVKLAKNTNITIYQFFDEECAIFFLENNYFGF